MSTPHTLAEIVPALEAERNGTQQQNERADTPTRFVRGGDFILDAPEGVQSIWGEGEESLWQAGEPLLIVAPIGVGKTTVAGQLVKNRTGLGDGELFGYPVQPTDGKLLYIAADRPAQIARSMARMFAESDRAALNERVEFWKGPPPFDVAKEPEKLAPWVRSRGATELWIDSVKDVALDLSKDETGSRFNNAVQSCIADGIEVAALHHQRKASGTNTKPNTLHDVYGSTWIPAGAGSVLLLWGRAGDPIVELSHLKPPAEAVGPLQILHDFTRGVSRLHESMDAYDLLRVEGSITAQGLAQLMYGPQATASEVERARRKLDKLTDNRKATKQPSIGKEPVVYLPIGGAR